MIRAFVGAGGKTTLLKKQAAEFREKGLSVFVTTTTHMFVEEETLLTDDAQTIIQRLKEQGYAMAGLQAGEKIKALSPKTYEEVCAYADVVLVEADGSKHLPIKFPSQNEPVIWDNVEEIIVVCGLHALGKRACEAVHRLPLAKQYCNICDDTIITAEHIQMLVMEGYVRPLRQKYPQKSVLVYASHDGSEEQQAISKWIERSTNRNYIMNEWHLQYRNQTAYPCDPSPLWNIY